MLFARFVAIYFRNNVIFSKVSKKFSLLPIQKARRSLFTMKLDSPEFRAILTDEVQILEKLFVDNNYEIRIAGGAVRDLLLGIQPKDLDFATTATPDEMKEMFTKNQIRMINMTGEKHGTITPRINDKENFEVTTLRIDVVTYGRAAEVKFVKDWQLDSNRRDLTINSMFLGLDGTVYDYFNGYDDLKKRRVVFVGDAQTRIREDYLRILRYFRFYGRISESPDNHDPGTLEALQNNSQGLEKISGERIWTELHKTLEGNFASDLLRLIVKLGIGKYIGLPEEPDLIEFEKLVTRTQGYAEKLRSVTLLAAMLKDMDKMNKFRDRCKISNVDRDLGRFIVYHRHEEFLNDGIKPYQLLAMHSKLKISETRQNIEQLLLYRGEFEKIKEFQDWVPPRFPVNGNMIKEKCPEASGKEIGQINNKLKEIWEDGDFQPTAEELLTQIPAIVANRMDPKRKRKESDP